MNITEHKEKIHAMLRSCKTEGHAELIKDWLFNNAKLNNNTDRTNFSFMIGALAGIKVALRQ